MATPATNESPKAVNDVLNADAAIQPEVTRAAADATAENAPRGRWDMNEVLGLKRRLQ